MELLLTTSLLLQTCLCRITKVRDLSQIVQTLVNKHILLLQSYPNQRAYIISFLQLG
jgi:hypothetical protein